MTYRKVEFTGLGPGEEPRVEIHLPPLVVHVVECLVGWGIWERYRATDGQMVLGGVARP